MDKKQARLMRLWIIETLENFLKEEYNVKLIHKVLLKSNMVDAFGAVSYFENTNGTARIKNIMYNKDFFEIATIEECIDTIKHEGVHYALMIKGETGYHDGDKLFESELIRLGIRTKQQRELNKRYSLNLEIRMVKRDYKVHVLKCKNCGKLVAEYRTTKEMLETKNTKVSSCCNAPMEYVGEMSHKQYLQNKYKELEL